MSEETGWRSLRVAWLVLGLQLAAMVAWSTLLYARWQETFDFAMRYQAWWSIAHGDLDPYATVAGYSFFQDHFALVNWAMAPLSRLWGGGLWLAWAQDAIVVAGESGALLLVADATRRSGWPAHVPRWVAVALVTLLLVANPWVYATISFDVHFQTVAGASFAMLCCRELVRGEHRRRVAVWAVLTLACGDVAATYLAAVGLSGVLLGRPTRRAGGILFVAGLAWFVLITAIGANHGSYLSHHFAYLLPHDLRGKRISAVTLFESMASHPLLLVEHVWSKRAALWPYASSAGLLGAFTPLSVLPDLVLVEAGMSQGRTIAGVAFNQFGAVLFTAPLSVLALGWASVRLAPVHSAPRREVTALGRTERVGRVRRLALSPRRAAAALGALLAANAVVWAIVWIPQLPGQWLTVPTGVAATLDRVQREIPPGAEVVASQGVVGRLADRRWVYAVNDTRQIFPLHTANDYFVVVPYAGIEVASVEVQEALVGELAGSLHARLLLHAEGVWLFRLHRRHGTSSVSLPVTTSLPAWTAETVTGRFVTTGPPSTWHVAKVSKQPGYLLFGAEWNRAPGDYVAHLVISCSATVQLQVWDTSAGKLLAEQNIDAAPGRRTVAVRLRVVDRDARHAATGWGPYSFVPVSPPANDEIEVRLWTSGAGAADVYRVALTGAALNGGR